MFMFGLICSDIGVFMLSFVVICCRCFSFLLDLMLK